MQAYAGDRGYEVRLAPPVSDVEIGQDPGQPRS